jgi:hypothetical protein
VVTLAGDRDHIGCFADQVKMNRALVRDLDEAVKEVNLLGEHEEESSQKTIKLEAFCICSGPTRRALCIHSGLRTPNGVRSLSLAAKDHNPQVVGEVV